MSRFFWLLLAFCLLSVAVVSRGDEEDDAVEDGNFYNSVCTAIFAFFLLTGGQVFLTDKY